VFNLFGGEISWMNKRHSIVALSTTRDKYMESTHARKEAVWLQILCLSMGLVQRDIRIDCDNQSEIFLENIHTYHSKKKKIDVQYHFVGDMVEENKAVLVKVDTLKNVVDSLMKFVIIVMFSWFQESMAVAGPY